MRRSARGRGERWRSQVLAMLAFIVIGATGFVGFSPAPVAAAARSGDGQGDQSASYTFAFEDADIAQIAQEVLGSTLGLSFAVDPAITGKMSFRIDQRLTRAQLLEAFEAALDANDVVMVREGDSLKLEPRAKAKSATGMRTLGEGEIHHAGFEVVAVPMAYASPSEVSKVLDAIAPANTVIYANDKLGLLILGGSGAELDAALQTVREFDRNGLEDSKIRWITLTQAPAETVASELQHLLDAADVSGVTIAPLKRLNGLVIFGRSSESLDTITRWVAKLDVAQAGQASAMWIYHPHSVSAASLKATLSEVLFGDASSSQDQNAGAASPSQSAAASTSGSAGSAQPATPAQANQPAAPTSASGVIGNIGHIDEDAVHLGVDKGTNSLLVFASPTVWVQIQKLLQEIDQPPTQILIEASILEVTLTNDLQYGVDWSTMGANGRLTATYSSNSGGTVAASFPGLGVTYLDKNIQAAISALKSLTDVEVVSAPKIITLDNQTAKLDVGDQVPVLSQSAQSTAAAGAPIVSSVDYVNTGVILNVTPTVSGDDKIVLAIEQEVSSVAQTTTSGIDSPTIQQRKFDSNVVLKNGGVVALGGLISSTKTKERSGIPFLVDAPLIGSLFNTVSNSLTRTELIVLLSAKIIPDDTTSDHVMADMLADMQDIQRHGLLKSH